MAWTSKIKQVLVGDNLDEGITLKVEFTDGKDTVAKDYAIHAKHVSNRAEVDALVDTDLTTLKDFRVIVDSLVADAEIKDTKPAEVIEPIG